MVTLYSSIVFGILVETGSSIPDCQVTTHCPGTLSEGRVNKLQGDALVISYKEKYAQTLLGAGKKGKREKGKKGSCECQLYCIVYKEQHQYTDDMKSAHLKNFCINTSRVI